MFKNLKEKTEKNFNSKKNSNFFFFSSCPTFVFDQKLLITLVSQIIILHKLYSHVCYAMAYHHKKFQIFNIKTLTIIACLNFKNWLWAFRVKLNFNNFQGRKSGKELG